MAKICYDCGNGPDHPNHDPDRADAHPFRQEPTCKVRGCGRPRSSHRGLIGHSFTNSAAAAALAGTATEIRESGHLRRSVTGASAEVEIRTNTPPPRPRPRRIAASEITEAIEKALRAIDLPIRRVTIGRIAVDPKYTIDDAELLTAGVAVKLSLIAREEP